MSITIRPEISADESAIAEVTQAAFANHPHRTGTEHLIVAALREADALRFSLVAERQGRVVGHVAASKVLITDRSRDRYGLGPVSVLPRHQRQGIGTALIDDVLAQMGAAGAQGCVVLGEPAFYGRFGFVHDPAMKFDGAPARFFLALRFQPGASRGSVVYHPAFFVLTKAPK